MFEAIILSFLLIVAAMVLGHKREIDEQPTISKSASTVRKNAK